MLAPRGTRLPLEDPGHRRMDGFRKCGRHTGQPTRPSQPSNPKAIETSLARHGAAMQRIADRFSMPPADFLSGQQPQRKWRRSDSNRRPPACKAGALPLSYAPAGEDRQQLRKGSTRTSPMRCRATTQYVASRSSMPPADTFRRRCAAAESMGQGGLEPPTPRLSSVCSNQLSYWPRMRGVAQSGEGCAVGARRGLHRDQAHRHGRYISKQPGTSVRGRPARPPHPGQTAARHAQGAIVMKDATQGPRRTHQADILERR